MENRSPRRQSAQNKKKGSERMAEKEFVYKYGEQI